MLSNNTYSASCEFTHFKQPDGSLTLSVELQTSRPDECSRIITASFHNVQIAEGKNDRLFAFNMFQFESVFGTDMTVTEKDEIDVIFIADGYEVSDLTIH